MKARAATLGSTGTALLIGGLAMMLGSGSSTLLIVLGALAAMAGLITFGTGLVLHSRAIKQSHRGHSHAL